MNHTQNHIFSNTVFSGRSAVWRAAFWGSLFLAGSGAAVKAAPAQTVVPAAKTAPKRALVKAQLSAFKVASDGKLTKADAARPGDLIEYQVRYSNTGDAPATNFKPQLPIPDALIYVAKSAAPLRVWASLDSKAFLPAPLRRAVKNAAGTTSMVPVPLAQYRALRWNLGTIAPGKSVVVKARARLATG